MFANRDIQWLVLGRLGAHDHASLDYALRVKRPADNLEIAPVSLANAQLFLFWHREGYTCWTREWNDFFNFFKVDQPHPCCADKRCRQTILGPKAWPQTFIDEALKRGDIHEAKFLIHNVHEPIPRADNRESLIFALEQRPEWKKDLEWSVARHGTIDMMCGISYPMSMLHVDQALYCLEMFGSVYIKTKCFTLGISSCALDYLLDNNLISIDSLDDFVDLASGLEIDDEQVGALDKMVAICRLKFNADDVTQTLLSFLGKWDVGRYVRLSEEDKDPNKLQAKPHYRMDLDVVRQLRAKHIVFLRKHVGMQITGIPFTDTFVEEIAQSGPNTWIYTFSSYENLELENLATLALLKKHGITLTIEWFRVLRTGNMECIRILAKHRVVKVSDKVKWYALFDYLLGASILWEHLEELVHLLFDMKNVYEEFAAFPVTELTRSQRICLYKYLCKIKPHS